MMMMMKKKMSVVLVVLILCVMASNVDQSFAQINCVDYCTTGCVGQFINNPRSMSRCDSKCQIECGPDSQVKEKFN